MSAALPGVDAAAPADGLPGEALIAAALDALAAQLEEGEAQEDDEDTAQLRSDDTGEPFRAHRQE